MAERAKPPGGGGAPGQENSAGAAVVCKGRWRRGEGCDHHDVDEKEKDDDDDKVQRQQQQGRAWECEHHNITSLAAMMTMMLLPRALCFCCAFGGARLMCEQSRTLKDSTACHFLRLASRWTWAALAQTWVDLTRDVHHQAVTPPVERRGKKKCCGAQARFFGLSRRSLLGGRASHWPCAWRPLAGSAAAAGWSAWVGRLCACCGFFWASNKKGESTQTRLYSSTPAAALFQITHALDAATM